jgi:hypothetical protein
VVLIILNTTISSVSLKVQDSSLSSYRTFEDYNYGLQKILDESIFNKSKLTLRTSKLENSIKEAFPEVSKATVIIPLAGRKLKVGLQMDQPLLRLVYQDNRQGIVGESGRLLVLTDKKVVLSSFSSLVSLIIEPNLEFVQGNQVLTTTEIELISLLLREFDGSTTYKPKTLLINFKVEKREIQVNFEGKAFFAKLTPERDAKLQIGSLVATLKQLNEQGSEPSEYLDVRVEERVYVK